MCVSAQVECEVKGIWRGLPLEVKYLTTSAVLRQSALKLTALFKINSSPGAADSHLVPAVAHLCCVCVCVCVDTGATRMMCLSASKELSPLF